jgi:hypothetical protein
MGGATKEGDALMSVQDYEKQPLCVAVLNGDPCIPRADSFLCKNCKYGRTVPLQSSPDTRTPKAKTECEACSLHGHEDTADAADAAVQDYNDPQGSDDLDREL